MDYKIIQYKTKYRHMNRKGRRPHIRQNLTVVNYNIEAVLGFMYLGTLVNGRTSKKTKKAPRQ